MAASHKVIKRNGEMKDFCIDRIINAISKAMINSKEGSLSLASDVANDVYEKLTSDYFANKENPTVEKIQDLAEDELMSKGFKQTAKHYITYRNMRTSIRKERNNSPKKNLPQEDEDKAYFASAYNRLVYKRTYAKWLNGRRETWEETINRYFDFMYGKCSEIISERVFDTCKSFVLDQKVMPSMRLLQFSGEAAENNNICAYNCSFIAPTCIKDFGEIIYILMCGVGVGFSVQKSSVDELGMVRKQKGKIFPPFVIPDSKEGWAEALIHGMTKWYEGFDVTFDYSELRPFGARLKTMGGKSSGPDPLRDLLDFTRSRILKSSGEAPKKRNSKMLPDGPDWTFELLERYHKEIKRVAQHYRLDTYPNQIEVITSEQMMDAYSSIGMPINYNHWSFGKKFIQTEQNYKHGQMGLAYEIVINSNPCIAYLMEENTVTMQALVIAHACYGHNSFFKGNYLFQTWTDASSIIDYLLFAKKYLAECEERYGVQEVEKLLDSCHALMNFGVDRYKRPEKISITEEKARQEEREAYLQSQVNELWRTVPRAKTKEEDLKERFPSEPQENLLYFFEKHAPLLEPWQREVVRIVRKISQYFYPQKQTQVMNEGWATFWHYTILNHLYDEGLVSEKFILEFLHSHTSVVAQPPYNSPYFNGINPYALGFAMFRDIKRICEEPTDEDKEWFPDLAGTDWLDAVHFAMHNFKDESFISQYLSPKLMRDFKLFAINDDDHKNFIEVAAIHDEMGYKRIRETLAAQYNLSNLEPNIQVFNVDVRGDRSLTLQYVPHNRIPLDDSYEEVLKHVYRLWGFDVILQEVKDTGHREVLATCPKRNQYDTNI